MSLDLSRMWPLSLVLLMSGERVPSEESVQNPTVIAGSTCVAGDLPAEVEAGLQTLGAGERDELEFVLAAGPNRSHTLPSAIALIKQVEADTHYHISIVLRVDEGELPAPLVLENSDRRMDSSDSRWDSILGHLESGESVEELLNQLDADVTRILAVQEMGTSYTEVADSIEETQAKHLVFMAHNWPLQWRLELAAQNTVSSGMVSENLQTVQVLCHDGGPLPSNTSKELVSFAADGFAGVFGHDFVMQTSRGGHRLARTEEAAEEALGL